MSTRKAFTKDLYKAGLTLLQYLKTQTTAKGREDALLEYSTLVQALDTMVIGYSSCKTEKAKDEIIKRLGDSLDKIDDWFQQSTKEVTTNIFSYSGNEDPNA